MQNDDTVSLGGSRDDTRPAPHEPREQEARQFAQSFLGRMLGDYLLEREVGHGSMGIVFKATHQKLQQVVAIKVLPPSLSVTSTVIKRFLREAQSVAKLDHENIVKIYTVGDQDGVYFYAMQFIEGRSLDHAIAQSKLSHRECARIISDSARALFFAHEAAIIHRDIKPSNILLTFKDKPILTDFGLARPEKAATLTESGALVGTPIYMSPEQVRGDRDSIDRRTDIYSLGITLYEMLAGQTPFEASSTQEILRKIEYEDPAPLRRHRPDTPRALQTICMKAIEKDPRRRYQTAIEMALDLERFLKGEPIQARSATFGSRWMRRARRHPAIFWMACALVLAIGFTVFSGVLSRADRQKQQYQQLLSDGLALSMQNDSKAAQATFDHAIDLAPGRPEAYVERGVVFFYNQAYESALADFDRALEVDKSFSRAKLWRGVTRCQEKQDSGFQDVKETLHDNPDDPEVLYEAARLCLGFARASQSRTDRDLLINSSYVRVQKLLEIVQRAEQLAAAEGPGKTKLRYKRDDALVLQGMLFEEQGMMPQALKNYEEASRINANNALALRLLMSKRPEQAADAEEDGAPGRHSAPTSTWWYVLGNEGLRWASKKATDDSGFIKRAASAFSIFGEDDATGTRPPTVDVDVELTKANELWDNDRDQAAAIYERVLLARPDVAEPHTRLAEYWLDRPGGLDKAVMHIERARKAAPANPVVIYLAARIYSQKQDTEKMRELAQTIARYYPAVLSMPGISEAIAPFLKETPAPPKPPENGKDG